MGSPRFCGVAVAVVLVAAACGGGGGGGGGGTVRHTLTVTISGAAAGGRVTSTPAGIDCPGACSAQFDEAASVTLAQAPAAGHLFTGWSGACSGTGPCTVTLSGDRTVGAGFDGPTEVAVSTPYGHQGFPLSLLPGETRTVAVSTTLVKGAPGQAALTASGLPAGVTAAFTPASVTAGGSSTLSLTAAAGAPATATPAGASVVGTSAFGARSAALPVEVRSARALTLPAGLAWEENGLGTPTTAVVAEAVPGFSVGRLVRVDAANGFPTRTIASGLLLPSGPWGIGLPQQVAVDNPATFALVASSTGLARVDLSTGSLTTPAPALGALAGVAVEQGTGSAVVTECGTAAGCSAGRLSRVVLATGAVTTIATGLNDPAGVIKTGGFVVVERGAGRVLQVYEGSPTEVLADGLDHPAELAAWYDGSLLVTTAAGDVTVVGPSGGSVPFLDLPGGGVAYRGISISSWQNVLVSLRGPDRLARLHLVAVPSPTTPSTGATRLSAPRAFASGANSGPASGIFVTDCGPGGEAGCALTGRVVHVFYGQLTPIVTGLDDPAGIAPLPYTGRFTLLLAERGAGRLLLVDVEASPITVTPVATGLPSPWGVAPEADGTTALVSASDGIYRVVLATGAATRVAPLSPGCGAANHGRGLAIGATPNLAYVAEACPPQVSEVDLDTGALTPLSLGVVDPQSVRTWGEVLVADAGQGGRLLSGGVSPSPTVTLASSMGPVVDADPNGFGGMVWLSGDQLFRSVGDLTTTIAADRLVRPTGLAVEPLATALLLTDCGGDPACQGTGRLVQLDLFPETQTVLFTGLTAPAAVAREGSLRVLVADCETAVTCATAGRLSRVEGASRTTVAGPLADPAWIAIEPSGTTALVAERAAGRITRVDLASGARTTVASGLAHPRQVELEAGGNTALVAEDGRIARLTLATGAATQVIAWDAERFAVDPAGGRIALLPRSGAPGPAQVLAYVDLATGLVTVQASRLTHAPDTLVWVNWGRLFFTERRDVMGAVRSIAQP